MSSGQRTKWTFFVTRAMVTNCTCNRRQAPPADKTENLVVMGRMEHFDERTRRRGEHQHRPRLELTAIAPFDSRSKEFRRALRAIKDPDACRANAARQSTVPDSTVEHRRAKPQRKAWRLGGRKQQYQQQPELASAVRNGGDGRRMWGANKMPKRRADGNRERKEGVREILPNVNLHEREKNRRQLLQTSSPLPALPLPPQKQQQHQQLRRRQQQNQRLMRGQAQTVDEEAIMANRRDRIERRKPTGDRQQRKTSRRNNRNDGRRRDYVL